MRPSTVFFLCCCLSISYSLCDTHLQLWWLSTYDPTRNKTSWIFFLTRSESHTPFVYMLLLKKAPLREINEGKGLRVENYSFLSEIRRMERKKKKNKIVSWMYRVVNANQQQLILSESLLKNWFMKEFQTFLLLIMSSNHEFVWLCIHSLLLTLSLVADYNKVKQLQYRIWSLCEKCLEICWFFSIS